MSKKPQESLLPEDTEVAEVVVKAPEDWPEATDVRGSVSLDMPDGTAKFDVRALSHAEHNEIILKYPVPQMPGDKASPAEKTAWGEVAGMAKLSCWIAAVNACWKPLPGETVEAQAAWALNNLYRNDEILSLYAAIRVLSGRNLLEFNNPNSGKSISVDDPSRWAEITQRVYEFRIPHPNSPTLVFKVKGLSAARVAEIDKLTEVPEPPIKPVRGPRGRVEGAQPDAKDPKYLQTVRSLDIYRDLLILESALSFEIPGATQAEKIAWIGRRPFDEVDQLRAFVCWRVANIQDRADFTFGG
ncbi:MAG: hypothetical protein ABIH03_14810 [Pseudomonadota bacterium]